MAVPSCPSRPQLSAFCLGDLPPAELERIAAHLDACSSCQDSVSGLELSGEDLSDGLTEQLRGALSGEAAGDELPPQLQALIRRAGELRVSGSASTRRRTRTIDDASAPEPQAAPRQVGHYLLLEQIGEGGMGKVYRALHANLQKQVAVKLLPPERTANPRAAARFRREMRAVGRLHHGNIITAHDAGEDRGVHYLAMELVDGVNLSQLARSAEPLSVADACELIRQAALGLGHAHQAGLVHRDVKPSNLMLDRSGTVKILDLGLAMLTEEGHELTSTGQLVGTFKYMAPEQLDGGRRPDVRCDVYSLGASLYRLLCGSPPFSGPRYRTAAQMLAALASESAPSPRTRRSDVPLPLEELLLRMLARRAEQRPAEAEQVAAALTPFCQGADLETLAAAALAAERGGAERQSTVPPTAPPGERPGRTRDAAEGRTRQWPPAGTGEDAAPRQAPAASRPSTLRRAAVALLAAALLLAGGVLAAQIYQLRFPRGTLTIEVNDPSVEAILTEQGVEVVDRKSGRRYRVGIGDTRLPHGQYQLQVSDADGLSVETSRFAITGENKQARIAVTLAEAAAAETAAGAAGGPQFEPVHRYSLVASPAPLEGLRSWTIETVRHRGMVRAARFQPQGGLLATAGEDRVVRIWDSNSMQLEQALLGHSAGVASLCWAPDGGRLAAGDGDGAVRIWRPGQGTLERTLRGHQARISGTAWPAGADRLASVDQQGGLRIWDVESGRAVMTASSHQGVAYAVAWGAADGPVATGGSDGFIRLWRPGRQEPLQQWPAHGGLVSALAWSPDGGTLASGGRDGLLQLWRPGDTAPYLTVEAHPAQVSDLRWSPAGDRICTVTMHGEMTVWDVAAAAVVHSSRILQGTVGAVDFHASGDLLVTCSGSGGGAVRLWDSASGRLRKSQDSHPRPLRMAQGVAVAPDGGWIAAAGGRGVRLWDAQSAAASLLQSDQADAVAALAWSPDGRLLAAAGFESLAIWDAREGRWRDQFAAQAARLSTLAWGPQSSRLAGVTWDRRLLTWSEGQDQWDFVATDPFAPQSLAWSADGRLALAGGNVLRILADPAQQQPLHEWNPGQPEADFSLAAWSPAGDRLAVAASDKTVRIVDARSGQQTQTIACGVAAQLAWSPDGAQLAVAGGGRGPAQTWDVQSGELVRDFSGHDGGVTTVSWSSGGTLVTAGHDGTVRCWDAASGSQRCLLLSLEGQLAAAIGAAGQLVASPGAHEELTVVGQHDRQQLYGFQEFAEQFGWQDDDEPLLPLVAAGR